MRHLKSGRKLKRTASHRKALLSNLALALFISDVKRIRTTLAKAKEARILIDNLITKAKRASVEDDNNIKIVHAKREIYKYIRNRKVIEGIFTDVLPKVKERPGGYTRIVKIGQRLGDAADMAILELVDFNIAQDKNAVAKDDTTASVTKELNNEVASPEKEPEKKKKTIAKKTVKKVKKEKKVSKPTETP
jgi:large subunit ribosomal protein L17